MLCPDDSAYGHSTPQVLITLSQHHCQSHQAFIVGHAFRHLLLIYTLGTDQSVGIAPGKVCKKESDVAEGSKHPRIERGYNGSTGTLRAGGPKTGEFVQLHYSNSPYGPWTFLSASGDPHNPGIFKPSSGYHGTNPTPCGCCRTARWWWDLTTAEDFTSRYVLCVVSDGPVGPVVLVLHHR
jgi:hypothetical protein